jgi:hypothetical protein
MLLKKSEPCPARTSLDRTQMQIDDNLVNLSPGMAVTNEIKTALTHSHQLFALPTISLPT